MELFLDTKRLFDTLEYVSKLSPYGFSSAKLLCPNLLHIASQQFWLFSIFMLQKSFQKNCIQKAT